MDYMIIYLFSMRMAGEENMKYLWVLFIFLFAFAAFITYTVIADGDIDHIFNSIDENKNENILEKTNGVRIIKNYIIKENETTTFEYIDYIANPYEYYEYNEEKQIFISVFDAKTNTVSTVDLEEYLCGVVFSEMPPGFEIEALKAQSVAARSFCVYKMLYSSDDVRKEHHGADICNDYKHCKDYISYDGACEKYGADSIDPLWDKIKSAVDSTKGEIITYESEPAAAVFHAMSGTKTESAQNVWGNAVPYLIAVPSEEEQRKNEIPGYITENILAPDQFKNMLISNGFRADFPVNADSWITNFSLNSSGRVDTADICGKTITGRRLREIFSLRSTDFKLEYKNKKFIFTVTGYGHGVGLSQYGANLMAGDGKNYIEILMWYYTGVEISQAGRFF